MSLFRSCFELVREVFSGDDSSGGFYVAGFAGSGIGDAFTMVVWLDE